MDHLPSGHPDCERALGHPVEVVLPPAPGGSAVVAVSRTGAPPQVRAAWVAPERQVVARIACPPGVPSAVRPITATLCTVSADGVSDQILLGRVAPGVVEVRAVVAAPDAVPIAVHGNGLLAGRLPRGTVLVALDALVPGGESVGRLIRPGVNDISLVAGRREGRMGASHGMAAGFGAGDTVAGIGLAELEAGYPARLPSWLPDGLALTTVRVEPDVAYPFAPPSIAVDWTRAGSRSRVLLRQCPGPLAVPELPDARGTEVDIAGVRGVLRARGIAFLVWERADRAFGVQVSGTADPAADAVRIAASIAAPPAGMP